MPTETFTSGTSWTCPAGVYRVKVEGIGGGGRGGTRTTTGAGGGGGGGAYATIFDDVVPGTVYSYTIGQGSSTTAAGTDTTWRTNVLVAKGGSSCGDDSATGVSGGLASACTPTTGAFNGGSGANGSTGSYGGGGGESASDLGAGNNASTSTGGTGNANGGDGGAGRSGSQGNGTGGTAPGGAGGGGLRTSSQTRTGGAGANGQLQLTYARWPASLVVPTGQPPIKMGYK